MTPKVSPIRRIARFAFPILVLLFSILALVSFGFLGVGRPGTFAFDMPYLYVAGEMWEDGLSPYRLDDFRSHMAALAQMIDSGSYAYGPNSAPLALVLSVGSLDLAKVLIGALGIASILVLCAFVWLADRRSAPAGYGPHGSSGSPASAILASAVVIGNPFTAHIVWMGQTTLVSSAFLFGSWLLADCRKDVLAGVLLGIAAFKPQLALLVGLWFLLDRRWTLLVAAALTTVAASGWPLLANGVDGSWLGWLDALREYKVGVHSALNSKHVFGLRSMLLTFGIGTPTLVPAAFAGVLLLYYARENYESMWLLPAILVISFLLVYSHDYDLAPAVVLSYPLLKAAAERKSLYPAILLLGVLLFFPQRIWQRLDLGELARSRELALLGMLAIYLVVCRIPRPNSSKVAVSVAG